MRKLHRAEDTSGACSGPLLCGGASGAIEKDINGQAGGRRSDCGVIDAVVQKCCSSDDPCDVRMQRRAVKSLGLVLVSVFPRELCLGLDGGYERGKGAKI